jgi:hypothetical protein
MAVNPAGPDNKAIRELRDCVKKLNETIGREVQWTRRFSMAFLAFAFAQTLVALVGLGMSAISSPALLPSLGLFTFAVVASLYIFRDILKDDK